jgi:hypothetical protein
MQDDDTTRAGGSEGASAPTRVEDAHVPLRRRWSAWVRAVRPNLRGQPAVGDPHETERQLADALERAPTSEILELFVYFAEAARVAGPQAAALWPHDSKPLADEIDRRIPRKRA